MNLKDLPAMSSSNTKENLKKYTGTASRILNILIGGATQEQAAKAVGVDPSYVSQLCAEEDFQLQIVQGIQSDIEKSVTIDQTYLEIEAALVKKLKELCSWMTTGDQVLKALRYVNEAKRKTQSYIPNTGVGGNNQEGTTSHVTTIIVPTFIQQHFTVTPNREIVGINDQPLVTLNSKQLNTMVQNSKTQQLPKPEAMKIKVPNGQSERPQDKWSDL